MTWMIIRLILSLVFIGAVLLYAARLAKKKGLGQSNGLIEVVARQRMGRASTINVVRIADVVLVIGATEEQITLLAEVDELDRAASAPADLLVNGTLIARGEVVVVDEDFGLRISEIVTDAASELGAVSA